jgi:hypothetical protein
LLIRLEFPKLCGGSAGLGEKARAARGRLETGGGGEERHRQVLRIADCRWSIFDCSSKLEIRNLKFGRCLASFDFRVPIFAWVNRQSAIGNRQ